MKISLYFLACFFNLTCSSAFSQTVDQDLDVLANFMCGSFSSEKQSKADTNFYDVRLEMIRIWKNQTGAYWFYVEQAYGDQKDKPYRQRVYRLSRLSDSSFESKVYEIAQPLRFAGEWKKENPLSQLNPDSITARRGCSLIIKKTKTDLFEGSTTGKECYSARKGASYATCDVIISETSFKSWDRGFDSSDEQVWGSEHGGYWFIKTKKCPVK